MLTPAFEGWDEIQTIPEDVKSIPNNPKNKMAIFGTRDEEINTASIEKFLSDKAKIFKEHMGHDIPLEKFVKYFKMFADKLIR